MGLRILVSACISVIMLLRRLSTLFLPSVFVFLFVYISNRVIISLAYNTIKIIYLKFYGAITV